MKKLFALIDCNNFYVSCERIFRPDLNNVPVVVLSNNDGCVVSRSVEAKMQGVPMAAPLYTIKDLIKKHKINVLSSNYALYGDISARVMRIIADHLPSIEIYSIDEAFSDLSGQDEECAYELIVNLQKTITKWVGIDVSIGLAPTRTLAKLACNEAKRCKMPCLSLCAETLQNEVLKRTPVGYIWGIGRKSKEKLMLSGFKTAYDLKRAEPNVVESLLGVVGKRKIFELNNIDVEDIDSSHEGKQSISSSKSFAKTIYKLKDLNEAVMFYATRTAEKLRAQKSVCHHVTVFITTGPFQEFGGYFNSYTVSFATPVSSTRKIIDAALKALDMIYKDGIGYKKAGVCLGGLVAQDAFQIDIFDPVDESDEKLATVMDKINKKMGRDTLGFGVIKKKSPWQSNANYKSPNYTTAWSDIIKVK